MNKDIESKHHKLFMTKEDLEHLSQITDYRTDSRIPHFGTEDEIFINKRADNFRGYESTSASTLLNQVKKLTPHLEGDQNINAIWVPQGLFYIYDGKTPEISTYPQKVEEGCINSIINSMKSARNFVYNVGKTAYGNDAIIKGWSTHYNLELIAKESREILRIKPIMDYFLSNPWSVLPTANFIPWVDNSINENSKVHIAEDFILDYNQINAGISFLIAHFYGKQKIYDQLLNAKNIISKNTKEVWIHGLEAQLIPSINKEKAILFSDYLAFEYDRLRKDIQFFGGEQSIQIIEAYLNGTKKTSIEEYKNEPKIESKEDWAEYNAHKSFYEITKIEEDIETPKINNIMKKHLENNSFKKIVWKEVTKKNDKKTTFSKIENSRLLSTNQGVSR